eukprot:4751693-Lingulodinium_polyedra.AAC.1
MDVRLAATAASAVGPGLPGPLPPGEGGPVLAFSDGACDHPHDPMLARVAWAVRLPGRGQGVWSGPVDGAQTAQRG